NEPVSSLEVRQSAHASFRCPVNGPADRVDGVVADALAVDGSLRTLSEQTLRRNERIVIDLIIAGLDIDRDYPSDVLFDLDLGAKIPLVDFFTTATYLIAAKSWVWHCRFLRCILSHYYCNITSPIYSTKPFRGSLSNQSKACWPTHRNGLGSAASHP